MILKHDLQTAAFALFALGLWWFLAAVLAQAAGNRGVKLADAWALVAGVQMFIAVLVWALSTGVAQ